MTEISSQILLKIMYKWNSLTDKFKINFHFIVQLDHGSILFIYTHSMQLTNLYNEN